MRRWHAVMVAVTVALAAQAEAEEPPDPRDARIEELERTMADLARQVQTLRQNQETSAEGANAYRQEMADLAERLRALDETGLLDNASWLRRFTLGGYGELHYNYVEDDAGDQFDIHRLVLYLGYDFNDWIKFHSETEIEHAFVTTGSGGEVSLEQAYVDFLLSDLVNVRAGRVLTPLGIINKKHEPPTFNGVERPAFDTFVIPTTWSSDGVGLFGRITPSLTYEAYVVGGLDGSRFNALSGIRNGRIKERPSLHEPAFTGRLDWHPFAERPVAHGQRLRLGLSTYLGGVDNGNRGRDPGVDADIRIVSADFEYSIGRFDFRSEIADIALDGARGLKGLPLGTAEQIFGWNFETGYHFLPDAWKRGRLEKADAVVFIRYDDFDTQRAMPRGVARDPQGHRQELTFGVSLFLTPNFVIKADYQFRWANDGMDPDNLMNAGVGFSF